MDEVLYPENYGVVLLSMTVLGVMNMTTAIGTGWFIVQKI